MKKPPVGGLVCQFLNWIPAGIFQRAMGIWRSLKSSSIFAKYVQILSTYFVVFFR